MTAQERCPNCGRDTEQLVENWFVGFVCEDCSDRVTNDPHRMVVTEEIVY